MFTTYRVPPVRSNAQAAAIRPLTEWFHHMRQLLSGTGKKNAARSNHAVQGC